MGRLDVQPIAAGIERALEDARLRPAAHGPPQRRKGLARATPCSWERTARETLAVSWKAIAAKR